jgi:hypothetical protein
LSSGFNTDVRIGEQIFHVQTEDRGPANPLIDSTVYRSGQIVHRRSFDYRQLAQPAAGAQTPCSQDDIRERVEAQHRSVIEDLRSGALDVEITAAAEQARRASQNAAGIEIQLLNAASWLTGGHVSLDLQVMRRADRSPASAAEVAAMIEGASEPVLHRGVSDAQGRVRMEFPLPALGKNDLALVIQARAGAASDELRFAMRSRPKAPPASASP